MTLADNILWLRPQAIQVARQDRQRRKVETKGLVESIQQRGVLNPLIVEAVEDNGADAVWYKLVAGERRLAAAQEAGLQLVPCRLFSDLDSIEAQIIELEENIKREDLEWQDLVRGISTIHQLFTFRNGGQTHQATADGIGVSRTLVTKYLRVSQSLGEERVAACGTVMEAINLLARRDERALAQQQQEVLDGLDSALGHGSEQEEITTLTHYVGLPEGITAYDPSMGSSIAPQQGYLLPMTRPKVIQPVSESLLHESFLQWAPRYQGQKFNLLHCDFPYGIEVFNGPQMRTGATQGRAAYDDSRDVYVQLIECLCEHLDRFTSLSAHLMFWFSEKHRDLTLGMFRELAPSWIFQPFPLIWVKTDNSGISSDSGHSPRHVYETCLLAARGRRPLVRVVGDAYGAPSDRKWHVSAKPVPVLKHFMTMLVDEHTQMLDPTAGSGGALHAAEQLGAQRVLGLEVDETQCGVARQALRQFRSLRSGGL